MNTGKTFKQLVNDQRMNKAKILLQNSNLSISEIADKVGINNQTNFYKRFKKLTKLTSNEFRKAFKSDNY
ncbi:helix-turn-helix domain-containing protein [Pediococcus ethanolidurans]|uniref:helix-turn-helix domain-containing protein n=1 Tax=Pediococcus ethanolidurans TaxID=319653 RepID=UPI0037CCA8F2